MSVSSPACCQLSGQLNAHYADPAAAAAKGIFSCGCAKCLAMPYYTPPPAGAANFNTATNKPLPVATDRVLLTSTPDAGDVRYSTVNQLITGSHSPVSSITAGNTPPAGPNTVGLRHAVATTTGTGAWASFAVGSIAECTVAGSPGTWIEETAKTGDRVCVNGSNAAYVHNGATWTQEISSTSPIGISRGAGGVATVLISTSLATVADKPAPAVTDRLLVANVTAASGRIDRCDVGNLPFVSRPLGVSPVRIHAVAQSGTSMDTSQPGLTMTSGAMFRTTWSDVPSGKQLVQVRVIAYSVSGSQSFQTIRLFHVRQNVGAAPTVTLLVESFTAAVAATPGTSVTLNVSSPVAHVHASDYYMMDFYADSGNTGNVQVTSIDQTIQ